MKETIILEGRYRIVRCLAQRPRLNLYLGRRIMKEPSETGTSGVLATELAYEPLVAVRELVLTGLPVQTRAQVEAAAFEEFISPSVFGSSLLPTTGDRVWIEGERHYLVTQLTDARVAQYEHATTLDALLLSSVAWPEWIREETALAWAIQLCRMVARLHRQGTVLGNLTPHTILVDGQDDTAWSPLLLPSWPPSSTYWQVQTGNCRLLHAQIFPIAEECVDTVFSAPELLDGRADERSDVYSLGALLYLLLTHFAPVSALRRRYAALEARASVATMRRTRGGSAMLEQQEMGLELIPPRFLNETLSPLVEQVVLCALEIEPTRRYQTAFAFVEALEALVDL